MASQILTVAKIVGNAASTVHERFRKWSAARTSDDTNEWRPDQWPDNVRGDADAFADRIRSNCHQPPIVFFTEFVDHWSFCPPQRFLGKHGFVQVYGDQHELSCLPLPLSIDAKDELAQLVAAGQHDEDRLFALHVTNAVCAWRETVSDGVVVIIRRVVGAAVEDHEIESSLTTTPPWL